MANVIVSQRCKASLVECAYGSIVHVEIGHESMYEEDTRCIRLLRIGRLVNGEVVYSFNFDVAFGHGR